MAPEPTAPSAGRAKPIVLFVDDEPRVVAGLAALLRKEYEVHLAGGGEQALSKMRELPELAVIISDMRMPGMDGAAFLEAAVHRCPRATRILLTGEAGRDGAIRAVNQGQIFRFLTKPCPVDELKQAIEAGVGHHRLLNAERTVLQETLVGCIAALMQVLSTTNPVAFGRADRIKRMVLKLASRLGCQDFWQFEAAAMLSQIGYVSLPPELVEKVYYGKPLTPSERRLSDDAPAFAIKLLEQIPRLDPIMQILTALNWTDAQLARLGDGTVGLGARVLGLVLEFDALICQGKSKEAALAVLYARAERFDANLIAHLSECAETPEKRDSGIEISLRDLVAGMTLLQDVRTNMGVLLIPQGFEVTGSLLERISHLASVILDERVMVLPPSKPPSTSA